MGKFCIWVIVIIIVVMLMNIYGEMIKKFLSSVVDKCIEY